MKLAESWVAGGQLWQGSTFAGYVPSMCVTFGGLYLLVPVYVGRRAGCLHVLAHGAMTYSGVPRVEVFVPPYPLWPKPPVPVQCLTLWLCHDTKSPSNTWPVGQLRLVFLGIVLVMYSLRVLLCLLEFNEQRMNLVTGVVARCFSDVSTIDRCNTCTIALFSATLVITLLIVGYIVGLVSPEGLDHVSSWVSSRRRWTSRVGDRKENPLWSMTLYKS